MLLKLNKLIERLNGLAVNIAGRITQSWRYYVAGAAFLFFVSVGLLIYAVVPHTMKPVVQFQTNVSAQATTTSLFARALDGVYVESASSTNLLPFAVMVENSADAWPLSGPAKANLVFEAPVEGSITRFMLVFDSASSSTVDQIGPVRSARPYYVDFANGIGSLYAHVGGSPEALTMLRSLTPRVEDLNEFFNGRYFWRAGSRYAPHNTYTSVEQLNRAVSNTQAIAFPFASWDYSDKIFVSSTVTSIQVPYQGIYRASWAYDASIRSYRRSQNGYEQKDADGSTVDVSNVVLLLTDSQVLDEIGRLKIRTTGMGKALLFRDGTVQTGVWRRSDGEHLRFETDDGRDMLFARGKTWISILTSEEAFRTVVN
jgi:hypothetical protein